MPGKNVPKMISKIKLLLFAGLLSGMVFGLAGVV